MKTQRWMFLLLIMALLLLLNGCGSSTVEQVAVDNPSSEVSSVETTTAVTVEPALAADANGNWFYYDGKGNVQSFFTGVVANEAGEWMVEKGQVNFDYDGTYMDDKGTTYVISGGKVTSKSETDLGNVSVEFKNALAKAQSYSDMMNMSKAGIYNQLTSEYGESFAPDAAQFAVDHVNANYNANALAKAESYQSMMNMSKNGVYDQLVSDFGEKFTASQAQYAVDHLPA